MRIIFAKDVPFDATLFSTSIGDAIVVKDDSSYKFFIHKISGIVLVGVTKSVKLIEGYHGINTIFEKKDLHARIGNAKVLQFFIGVFNDPDIKSFFQSAYDILKFRTDKWNGDVLARLYTSEVVLEKTKIERKFVSYLSNPLQVLYDDLMDSGLSKSETLRVLKKDYKEDFMEAFVRFKKDYPQKSILDD